MLPRAQPVGDGVFRADCHHVHITDTQPDAFLARSERLARELDEDLARLVQPVPPGAGESCSGQPPCNRGGDVPDEVEIPCHVGASGVELDGRAADEHGRAPHREQSLHPRRERRGLRWAIGQREDPLEFHLTHNIYLVFAPDNPPLVGRTRIPRWRWRKPVNSGSQGTAAPLADRAASPGRGIPVVPVSTSPQRHCRYARKWYAGNKQSISTPQEMWRYLSSSVGPWYISDEPASRLAEHRFLAAGARPAAAAGVCSSEPGLGFRCPDGGFDSVLASGFGA